LIETECPVQEFCPITPYATGRAPEWFVLRYVAGKEGFVSKLLRQVKLQFKYFVYTKRSRRFKPVELCWLPGYMFLNMDVVRDNWGQVLRMPYALEILGGPTPLPSGVIDDLALRLPTSFAKPSALACIAPGTRVRVRNGGAYEGREGPVTWSSRRRVKVMLMIFSCPREFEIDVSDVEIV
jgi:transcription antitermination factor NusG